MIKATTEFDWFPSPRWNQILKTGWYAKNGESRVTFSFQFDVGQYIPPDLWKAWQAPAGWRKSGFYLRANKNNVDDSFQLIFPCVRLYATARAGVIDASIIEATLKLMQRPYP